MKRFLYKKTPPLFMLSMVLLFLAACSGNIKDEDIQAKANELLQKNPSYSEITASVNEGVLTLEGQCESVDCDSLAESEVKNLEGVKSIENNIVNNVTDLTLRTSVQSIISKYQGVQADVAAGAVVLRGSIDKNQVQPLMNELKALKPKKLDNQLALK